MTVAVELRDVCAGYGSHEVVHDVSLQLEGGELVGVFGANGAGKSTVLRAITGAATVLGGEVVVLGRSVIGLKTHEVAALGVGITLQGNPIFGSLTVRENLLVAARLVGSPARLRVGEAISRFPELAPWLDRTASILSGGERQLVALARVLVGDPAVLLLDEPGAGLAPELLRRVLQRLRVQASGHGRAVLLVEQRVAAALPLVDRVVVMRQGRVVLLERAGAVDLETIGRAMLGSPITGGSEPPMDTLQ